ncbi:MAG: DUF1697 domain-containing protein [Jiangellales bacterium]
MATKYVVLLRGINVGGRNKVLMADLRAAFESAGYESVSTYIQSGNVLLTTDITPDGLESEIEAMLGRRFGLPLIVVVRSHEQIRAVVQRAPDGFGTDPGTHHSDTIFLKTPLTTEQVMHVVRLREGVDAVWAGDGVVYFQRLAARRTESRMSAIVGTPEYQQMTIRSWSTTMKLLALLDA